MAISDLCLSESTFAISAAKSWQLPRNQWFEVSYFKNRLITSNLFTKHVDEVLNGGRVISRWVGAKVDQQLSVAFSHFRKEVALAFLDYPDKGLLEAKSILGQSVRNFPPDVEWSAFDEVYELFPGNGVVFNQMGQFMGSLLSKSDVVHEE